jgi:hypothetical protein
VRNWSDGLVAYAFSATGAVLTAADSEESHGEESVNTLRHTKDARLIVLAPFRRHHARGKPLKHVAMACFFRGRLSGVDTMLVLKAREGGNACEEIKE